VLVGREMTIRERGGIDFACPCRSCYNPSNPYKDIYGHTNHRCLTNQHYGCPHGESKWNATYQRDVYTLPKPKHQPNRLGHCKVCYAVNCCTPEAPVKNCKLCKKRFKCLTGGGT
jgi:hypothetical protein